MGSSGGIAGAREAEQPRERRAERHPAGLELCSGTMRLLLLAVVALSVGCGAARVAPTPAPAAAVRCPVGDRGPTSVSIVPQRALPLSDPSGARWLVVALRLEFQPDAA